MHLPNSLIPLVALALAGFVPSVLSGLIITADSPVPTLPSFPSSSFQRRDVFSTRRPIFARAQFSNTTTSTSTHTPTPTSSGSSSTSNSPQPVFVAGGTTVVVAPGTTVIGGPGGGTFVVNGKATPIAEGETKVAEQGPTDAPEPTPSPSPSPTPTPPGQASRHMIVPNDGITASEAAAFTLTLGSIGALDITNTTRIDLGLVFWLANLTALQASEIAKNSIVFSVFQDITLKDNEPDLANEAAKRNTQQSYENDPLWERDGTIVRQTNAPKELKVLSQPRGSKIDLIESYDYDSKAGAGITVYVYDTGANTAHPEYINMPGSKRWLFTGKETVQEDFSGHGSGVLSKIAGPTFGTAKNADIVVVKRNKVLPGQEEPVSSILSGFVMILNDIIANGLSGKAVINMSFSSGLDPKFFLEKMLITMWEDIIIDLIAKDVVIVASSGNGGTQYNINRYPALFTKSLPVIAVGAVDTIGYRAQFSQGEALLTTSAPGVGITCASNISSEVQVRSGTSFAAPTVAGLAAYFLSLDSYRSQIQVPGQVAKNVQDLIRSTSWSRRPGGFIVASNNVNEGCSLAGTSKNKRQVVGCPSPTSSSIPTPTPSGNGRPGDLGGQFCPTDPNTKPADLPNINCPGGTLKMSNEGTLYGVQSTCTDDVAVEIRRTDGTLLENFGIEPGTKGTSNTFEPCLWSAYTIPKLKSKRLN